MNLYQLLSTIFIVIGSAFQAQLPNYVPANGLQGYWPFSGNANDISGNAYNGVVSGCALTNDRFNNSASAYNFNGTSDFIATAYTGILGSNPRAVSFWAKKGITSALGVPAVVWGDDATAARFDCGFGYQGSGVTIDGANMAITYVPINNPETAWHHYVFQFSNPALDAVEIYQDGIMLTQILNSAGGTILLNTVNNYNVHFGHFPYSSPYFYNGQLDDIGIWDRVLTACEIQQLFRSTLDLINVSATSTTICRGQSTTLSASGGSSYLWDNAANTATTLVSPTTSTNYVVTGTLVGGCVSTKSLGVFVSICTDIKSKISVKPSITIFPNPAKVEITVTGLAPLSHLKIYTALGSQIYSGSSDTEEQKIDLQFLKAGIYFLKVSGNHQSIIKKFIVE